MGQGKIKYSDPLIAVFISGNDPFILPNLFIKRKKRIVQLRFRKHSLLSDLTLCRHINIILNKE